MVRLQNAVSDAFHQGKKLLAVFVDIEKAFDMVWREGLLLKLSQKNITGNMYNFINDFLHNRSITVKVNGHLSNVTEIGNGIPQGSVISPTLFNVFINDITKALSQQDGNKIHPANKLNLTLFADDSAFWRTGRYGLFTQIQKDLNNLNKWALSWGIKVSLTKTVSMLFSHKSSKPINTIKLKIGNTEIPLVKEVKFLGVTFDKKLNFKSHIAQVQTRCKQTLNLLRVISGTSWGANTKTMLMVYKSAILSKIDYGCQAYGCAQEKQLEKLQKIQNIALRTIAKVPSTTSGSCLQVEYNIMPIKFRRQLLTLKYYLKIHSLSTDHPVQGLIPLCKSEGQPINKKYATIPHSFATIAAKIEQQTGVDSLSIAELNDTDPNLVNIPFLIKNETDKTAIPPFKKTLCQLIINDNYFDYQHIYTDGSKNPDNGKVGFATVVVHPHNIIISSRINDHLSIYTAEFLAIIKAMEWIRENKTSKTVIFSDSLSSLQSIAHNKSIRPDLLNQLYRIHQTLIDNHQKVIIEWVPAHIGLAGNEIADHHAKQSLSSAIDSEYHDSPHGLNEIMSRARTHFINQWQEQWDQTKHTWFYNIKPSVHSIRPIHSNTTADKTITKLRLGASRELAVFQNLFRNTNNNCVCGQQEDMSHYLLACPAHAEYRTRLIEKFKTIRPHTNFNAHTLLNPPKNCQVEQYQAIYSYISNTKPNL